MGGSGSRTGRTPSRFRSAARCARSGVLRYKDGADGCRFRGPKTELQRRLSQVSGTSARAFRAVSRV